MTTESRVRESAAQPVHQECGAREEHEWRTCEETGQGSVIAFISSSSWSGKRKKEREPVNGRRQLAPTINLIRSESGCRQEKERKERRSDQERQSMRQAAAMD